MADDRLNIERTCLEEARLWRERYRVLFNRNVAGVILTDLEGRIIDCNEPCAQIFGFDSRDDMLAHSAWDFYFERAEREGLLDRLRLRGYCPAEEVCLRGRSGWPVWVLTTRTVASIADGRPELLLGTVIDITAQKKARTRPCDSKDAKSVGTVPESEGARMADLSQKLATLLCCVCKSLQPSNLPKTDQAEIRECVLALEQIKMLMSELQLLHLFPK
jgi:PAS domain S-box-containing protein